MRLRELLKKNKLLYKIGRAINKKKYKRQEDRQRKALHKYGYEACQKAEEVLKNYKHCVFYGTLLGFIREKGFLRHDCDIDYAIIDDSLNWEEIHRKLIETGFKFCRAFSVYEETMEATYSYKGFHLDLFILIDKNILTSYEFYRSDACKYENMFHYSVYKTNYPNIEAVVDCELEGTVVKIPSNYKEILNCCYGANWEIPNKDWGSSDRPSVLTDLKGHLVLSERELLK